MTSMLLKLLAAGAWLATYVWIDRRGHRPLGKTTSTEAMIFLAASGVALALLLPRLLG